ncbi:UBA/TS-N domain-containing protein [Ditylenchus destructor]|uniref:UV excision repair protein RAD23 n=1 Tax=Ditylenchus destructor TaxID=166010 RepID=A0AAD4N028_9BILA|nr:UBA/TS-N domain-containing protein [Ditylenchus destructor]
MKSVTFRLLNLESFTLELDESLTIAQLKQKLASDEVLGVAIPAENQKLIFNGKVLEEQQTVGDLDGIGTEGKKFVVVLSTEKKNKQVQTGEAPVPRTFSMSEAEKTDETNENKDRTSQDAPESREATVTRLESMGYPREEVERALRAAFGEAGLAVEYLCNGIPAHIEQVLRESVPLQQPSNEPVNLEEVAQSNAFAQIRQRVNANPALLLQILQEIHAVNPPLMEAILQDPHKFLQLLGGRIATFDPNAVIAGIQDFFAGSVPRNFRAQHQTTENQPRNPSTSGATTQTESPVEDLTNFSTQELSDQDKANIEKIKSFGVSDQLVLEAYLSCDKDESLAVNYILQRLEEEKK